MEMFKRKLNQYTRDHLLPTLPKYIPQENQYGSKQSKRKQEEKLEDISTDENQDIYLYDRYVAQPTLTYC